MYSCRVCLNTHFISSQMKKEKSLHVKKRGICKSCNTEYERNRQMLIKAKNNPEKYLACNGCDSTFSARNTGNYSGNNQYIKRNMKNIKLRVICPFCKSADIYQH